MKDETRLLHPDGARRLHPTVNPPIEKGSSLIFETRAALYGEKTAYGRMGLAVQRELESSLCVLEGARHAKLTANGLQACALAIASVVKAGDHVLIADSLYGPTRRFCMRRLRAMGVSHTRFTPTLGAGIAELIQPRTKAIIMESPGSLTFDIMDTPAIAEIARRREIATIFDNTWSAGVFHKPLDLGIDIVVQALTKYPVGHADAMGGAVLTRSDAHWQKIEACGLDWGISLAPDDAYLALRGLKTLHTRLRQHEYNAYLVAEWLSGRDEVERVIHPGRADHPQHHIWQRDFTGASGLFGFVLKTVSDADLDRFLEKLKLFGMGFSWGGYESLIIPCDAQLNRMKSDPIHDRSGPLLRVHVGLEPVDDLIADLDAGFQLLTR